jgi:hypothetical protein
MATTAEIRNKALRMLGVLGRGQTARSEDADDMDNAYAELHAKLLIKGLTPWGDADADIPAGQVADVVALLSYSRMSEYNIPAERAQKIAAMAAMAEPNLRELQALPMQGTTPIENY